MSVFSNLINNKMRIVEYTDPNHIYVENIRSFFNLNASVAKWLCEVAVKNNFLEKHYEYRCPIDDSVIYRTEDLSKITPELICQNCELNEEDKFSYNVEDLKPHPFYKIRK